MLQQHVSLSIASTRSSAVAQRRDDASGHWTFRYVTQVIENGTIRKFDYGFLFALHSNFLAVSSAAVSTQYTNITDIHRTTAGRAYACIAKKNETIHGYGRYWILTIDKKSILYGLDDEFVADILRLWFVWYSHFEWYHKLLSM